MTNTTSTTQHTPDIALGLQTVPEIPEPLDLPVRGTLPPYLGTSTLYRVGPGGYEATHADGKPFVISHWFDGLTKLHAFRIDAAANAVHYQSRSHTASLERAVASVPRRKWSGFSFGSPDPCRSLLGKLFQLWTSSGDIPDPLTGKEHTPNVGVTVQQIPGKGLVTRTDANSTVKFDEDTLEVEHFFNLNEQFGVRGSMSASHGQFDSETGEYLNYSYDLGPPGPTEYTVFSVQPGGDAKVLGTVKHEPSYLHSFATTRNYVILVMWPIQISGIPVLMSRAVTSGMSFKPDVPTRFAVFARDGRGLVAEYESEAFFAFHTINAFEDDAADALVIDLSRYDNADLIGHLKLDHMRGGGALAPSTYSRYTLPNFRATIAAGARAPAGAAPKAGARPKAVRTVINAHSMELARVSAHVFRARHRFVYGVSSDDDASAPFSRIAKVDATTGARVTWGQGERVIVGEPIFVRNPDGGDEDDGCLLVVALDVARKASRMVVLDAKTMTEVASAEVPQVVPLGFHGAHRQK